MHRCFAALCLAAAGTAAAHDTWFEPLKARPGEVVVALGTGNQFPLHETAIGDEFVRHSGCRSGDAAPVKLNAVRYTDAAVVLRSAVDGGGATCWAELVPLDIDLPPDKIEIYLKEINASAAVRQAWADLKARGIPWRERYVKHARIEVGGAAPAPPGPVEMGMDVLLESGVDKLRTGETAQFRVLRDGVPLPDFAVELRGDRSRIGLWTKTDEQGRVRMRLPLAGRWVLRGVDLRLSQTRPDSWDSRFVTLAFEVRR